MLLHAHSGGVLLAAAFVSSPLMADSATAAESPPKAGGDAILTLQGRRDCDFRIAFDADGGRRVSTLHLPTAETAVAHATRRCP